MTAQLPILCLDFGTVRVGVALATSPLAQPLTIVAKNAQTLANLAQLCGQHQIKTLVVGISEGGMAEQSRAFGQQLAELTGLPIFYQDETLTSHQVHTLLQESGRSRQRREIDDLAAAQILQDFLDSEHFDAQLSFNPTSDMNRDNISKDPN